MSGKAHVLAAAASLAILAVTSCSSTTTTNGAGGVTPTSTATPTGTSTATSAAVEKAKAQVDACVSKVGATSLLNSTGRSAFVNCMQNLVPPAKQEAFKNCVSSAVVSDRLWTSEGRNKFIQTSVPNCVNQVA